MSAIIETRAQHLWIDDEGIVHVIVKPHAEVSLPDAVEAVRAVAQLGEEVKRPTLVDMRSVKSITRDARMYFAGAETAKAETATALIVGSPLTRAIGNFFLGLNKTTLPCRLFTTEADALAWLRGYLLVAAS